MADPLTLSVLDQSPVPEGSTGADALRNTLDLARLADELGYHRYWVAEHHGGAMLAGPSPEVLIGPIAAATERLRLGTGVTCPLIRIHPAIVAQAAATSAAMMRGRFFLGVGTGENLNEHVLGDKWPAPDERLEMLEEAVEVIRLLWQGGEQTHRGKHYTVDHARVYDLPAERPGIFVAAAQPNAAELAGRIGDGLISTSPDDEVVQRFEGAGGNGKRKLGMMHVAYDTDERAALKRATALWPNTSLKGSLGQELPRPSDFEGAAQMIEEEDVAETTPHGPDPARYLEMIKQYDDAGFTHVYIHQIGENQQEFAEFAQRELMPKL
jgi:G6PDH family F420-dependent oxidoreductase